jgi:peroxiredoxin
MMKTGIRRVRAGWIFALGALLAGCGGDGVAEKVRAPVVGQPAPAFAAAVLDGDSLSLADLKGEVVLLNIWATWCPPCREEMPALEALAKEYRDAGLHVVGVSIDAASATKEVRDFARQVGVTFTILLDPSERVSSTFRTTGVPETFLIGRDGVLLKRWIGKIDPASASVRDPVIDALGPAVRRFQAGSY